MISFLGLLCVLSSLAATGYSLTCDVCFVMGATSCGSTTTMTCSDDNACASIYTVTISDAGIKLTEVFNKGCVPKNQCNEPGIISISHARIKRSISCCDTDHCTPSTPKLIDDNFQPNGLICRSCASIDSTWCYTKDTIQCSGHENMCILVTTKISGVVSSTVALRGCATKSICDIGSQSVKQNMQSMEVTFSCTSGSMGLHGGFLFPAVASIVLGKLLS
ncbi:phospholipase A2 inhibitor gamma subunit B-like [Discoglossus pictus]